VETKTSTSWMPLR